jgi:hypothetical protein
VPDKTSDVVLEEGAESELDTTARVSSLSIKSGSKLTITGNLLVIPRVKKYLFVCVLCAVLRVVCD